MSYTHMFRYLARLKGLGIVLLTATIGWAVGIPFLINTSSAAQLASVSATASSSAPSVSTSYVIQFTTATQIGTNNGSTASTTRITFDPTGNGFDLSSIATSSDITISRAGGGLTLVPLPVNCSGGANELYVSQIGHTQPADFIEFTTCTAGGDDSIAPGVITVGINNAHVTNPAATGSYIVRIDGTMTDSGETRVAIVSSVTVTASVDSNLSFSIGIVGSSSMVNGDTTTMESTPTSIAFGTLSVGTSSIAAQDISVSTNAKNGFSVTVTENQDLSSANGATINAFKDGNAVVGAPEAWGAGPAGTIGSPNTYGHMGITSEDATLVGDADEFGTQLYAGLTATSTRTVLYHTGPADGTTANMGKTRVGFRVQISALQEAATDYTNQITYVCTPIF